MCQFLFPQVNAWCHRDYGSAPLRIRIADTVTISGAPLFLLVFQCAHASGDMVPRIHKLAESACRTPRQEWVIH